MEVIVIDHSTPIGVFSVAKDAKTKGPSLDLSKAVPMSFATKKPKAKQKKEVKRLKKQTKKKKQKNKNKKSTPRMELIR